MNLNSTIWLTSDSHFNHDQDFIWQARGCNSVEEMNEIIIEQWNSKVKDGDVVYHLGDVMLGTDYVWAIENLPKLKGKKYLAYGNHDTDKKIDFYKTHKIFEDITMGYRLKSRKVSCFLSHYPQYVVNPGDKAQVWSLHGHTHQTYAFRKDLFHCYNVGLDAHINLVNFEDIISQIKERKQKNENKNN